MRAMVAAVLQQQGCTPVCKLPSFLLRDFPLLRQVGLVAHQNHDCGHGQQSTHTLCSTRSKGAAQHSLPNRPTYAAVGVLLQLLNPVFGLLKAVRVGGVVHNGSGMGTSIVQRSQREVPFLPGCVPARWVTECHW
jgi:hypothetical protein